MEAEWLDGATGPALGVRFRGHVKRNEIGPVYWTTCRVTACDPGREFGFAVLIGDSRQRLALPFHTGRRRHRCHRVVPPQRLVLMRMFSVLGGQLRRRRNIRDMRKTLERIKAVVEAPEV